MEEAASLAYLGVNPYPEADIGFQPGRFDEEGNVALGGVAN